MGLMRIHTTVERTISEEIEFLGCDNGCGKREPFEGLDHTYQAGWALVYWTKKPPAAFFEPLAFCSWDCMEAYAFKARMVELKETA